MDSAIRGKSIYRFMRTGGKRENLSFFGPKEKKLFLMCRKKKYITPFVVYLLPNRLCLCPYHWPNDMPWNNVQWPHKERTGEGHSNECPVRAGKWRANKIELAKGSSFVIT